MNCHLSFLLGWRLFQGRSVAGVCGSVGYTSWHRKDDINTVAIRKRKDDEIKGVCRTYPAHAISLQGRFILKSRYPFGVPFAGIFCNSTRMNFRTSRIWASE